MMPIIKQHHPIEFFGVNIIDEPAQRTVEVTVVPVGSEGSLRLRAPSGNQLEIVDYRDVQFSKTDAVLAGMGLQGLEKSEQAHAEMRAKGLIA